jgi:hypothetical protein
MLDCPHSAQGDQSTVRKIVMRSLKTAKRPRLPRHSAKGISNETLLGQRGVNIVERIVLEMGFVWNPIHIESGIDGIIEIRDASTGETRNKIIQVQVKAVSKFAAEQSDGFSFSCERAHIGYWLGGTARVILIVCAPDTDEVYWKDLKTYFSLSENRNRCTVRFSKTTDQFSVSCRSALLSVAQPEGGLALGPLPKKGGSRHQSSSTSRLSGGNHCNTYQSKILGRVCFRTQRSEETLAPGVRMGWRYSLFFFRPCFLRTR